MTSASKTPSSQAVKRAMATRARAWLRAREGIQQLAFPRTGVGEWQDDLNTTIAALEGTP
jgi:hypothetical protein